MMRLLVPYWSFIFFLFALFNATLSYAENNTPVLYIIKTQSIPLADQLIFEVKQAANQGKFIIKEFDMAGKQDRGETIIQAIKKDSSDPKAAVLFTLGRPATQLAIDDLSHLPIIYSMADRRKLTSLAGITNMHYVSDKSSLAQQLTIIKQLLPSINTIGILTDVKRYTDINNHVKSIGSLSDIQIKLETVTSSKDTPTAYRKLISEVDAIIFTQDSTILNRHSLQFLITTSFENNIPTFIYSDYLVKTGFFAAYLPTISNVAKRVNSKANQLFNGLETVNEEPDLNDLQLHINRKTLKFLKINIPDEINHQVLFH